MRIEYHPALIFYAFGGGFSSLRCNYTHSVAEFHWEVSKMVFSPQGNDNFFMLFCNDVTTLSMQGLVSFFFI